MMQSQPVMDRTSQNGKAFGFDNIQEVRYENLKSLLIKSSRYSSLLLAKIQTDEKKAKGKPGRKRKANTDSNNSGKVTRCQTFDDRIASEINKEAVETAEDEDQGHDHLLEYDAPKSFRGELRDYQKHGMNWLLKLYLNGMNGILADEMGLGKTIQIIAHFCNLLDNGVSGPFLVIAPLSTLRNWVMELNRFSPEIEAVLYHGYKDGRSQLNAEVASKDLKKTVVVTSYDMARIERGFLSGMNWTYMVVDEGHRLKNMNCKLLKEMKFYSCQNKVLLTGTPLQNNLNELWSLLHFLMPGIFADLESFHLWLDQNALIKEQSYKSENDQVGDKVEQREDYVLSMVHQILTPFLLRRMKSEVNLQLPDKQELLVFCPMTELQLQYYKVISERTILTILGTRNHEVDRMDYQKLWEQYGRSKRYTSERHSANATNCKDVSLTASRYSPFHAKDDSDDIQQIFKNAKLTSFMVLLKRVCNHPFLIYNPHPQGDLNWYEDYVTASGKMDLLDKMLAKLYDRGHKVLLFSQWTSILDMIEDSLSRRQYNYCRIDGSVQLMQRQTQIDEFNKEYSSMFLFMLTTRAGGQGINLTAADTVIIFDSDWNPQMDLQAQDRCHRIGQTKPVVVYRLVTENSIDHTIIRRANAKRKLEKVVLKKGRFNASEKALKKTVLDLEDIKEILQKQESQQFQCREVTDEMIERLLDRDAILQMKVEDSSGLSSSSGKENGGLDSTEGSVSGDSGFFEVFSSSSLKK